MGNVRAIPFAGLAFCGATVKSAIREDCFRDKTMPAKHVTEVWRKSFMTFSLLSNTFNKSSDILGAPGCRARTDFYRPGIASG